MVRPTGLKEIELDDKILSLISSKMKEACIDGEMMLKIISRISEVQGESFGDVTEFIRNGRIYRIRTSLEDYFREEDIPTCEE